MSTAILKLSESGELQKIHDKWLARKACSIEEAKQDIDRLPLKSFWGLFLLCGSACVVALLLYLVQMVHQYMRLSGRGSQSCLSFVKEFLSFVKEKENRVHKSETMRENGS
jgi:ionotropic glutamate receptor